MKTTTEHCIKVCNKLLRGELSAVETYGQAIDKFSDEPAVDELRRIRADHSRSVSILAAHVREMGGEPETDSGAWGTFATAIQGAANLFGANSAMESLQKGEGVGRSDYNDALEDNEVMPESKSMIRNELLPPVLNHIAALDNLAKTV